MNNIVLAVSCKSTRGIFAAISSYYESHVPARAIHAHIHHRPSINGNGTVVFLASLGGYASERMG